MATSSPLRQTYDHYSARSDCMHHVCVHPSIYVLVNGFVDDDVFMSRVCALVCVYTFELRESVVMSVCMHVNDMSKCLCV